MKLMKLNKKPCHETNQVSGFYSDEKNLRIKQSAGKIVLILLNIK